MEFRSPEMTTEKPKTTVLKTALEKGWIGGTSGAAAMTVQVRNEKKTRKIL